MDGQDSVHGGLYGGGVLPPTVEDYKRMWEWQAKQLKPHEFEREAERNKRIARKEIFQQLVKEQVKVKNPAIEKAFFDVINLKDK